jgi:hypothetical protein
VPISNLSVVTSSLQHLKGANIIVCISVNNIIVVDQPRSSKTEHLGTGGTREMLNLSKSHAIQRES